MHDYDRFKKIRELLSDYRAEIENELVRKGRGEGPQPHLVME